MEIREKFDEIKFRCLSMYRSRDEIYNAIHKAVKDEQKNYKKDSEEYKFIGLALSNLENSKKYMDLGDKEKGESE